jgi:N-acetylglucosamine kinase-like BadF-type ATPase
MKIGLDIGGSKTVILEYRGYGDFTSRTVRGAFGLAEDSCEVLSELALALSSVSSPREVDRVVVNLGGKNTEQIRNTVKQVFPNAEIELYRESEGVTSLYMMRAFDANIVVMAGTGCIAFGENGDKRCVVGGWGKEIGDRGCGYSLGMSAIQATLLQLDSNLPELSPIAKKISGRETPFSFTDITEYAKVRDAVRARLPKTRAEVAALVPEIVESARLGCPLAQSLIERAGAEIADGVISAARKIDTKEVRVVVNGGMTAFSELWYDAFVGRIVAAHLELTLLEITNQGIENAIIYMLGEKK